MPRLIIAEGAAAGIERCRRFLSASNPSAARNAKAVIRAALVRLQASPAIGRPYAPNPELRELVIPFGDGGYIALYRHEAGQDAVVVVAFRHQREAGY